MFEYLEYLMNGIKKIGGDDIEMPKQRRADLEAFCKSHKQIERESILMKLSEIRIFLCVGTL